MVLIFKSPPPLPLLPFSTQVTSPPCYCRRMHNAMAGEPWSDCHILLSLFTTFDGEILKMSMVVATLYLIPFVMEPFPYIILGFMF